MPTDLFFGGSADVNTIHYIHTRDRREGVPDPAPKAAKAKPSLSLERHRRASRRRSERRKWFAQTACILRVEPQVVSAPRASTFEP